MNSNLTSSSTAPVATTNQQVAAMLRNAHNALAKGELDKAENVAKRILQHFPEHADALRLMVHVKRQAKDHKQEEQLLTRLYKLYPKNDQVLVDIAIYLESQNRLDIAELRLLEAVRCNPGNFDAQSALGRLAQSKGRVGRAEYHLRQAHYLRPADVRVCIDLGTVLTTLGRPEEAERVFRVALGFEPRNINAMLGWVKMEETQGRPGNAKEMHALAEQTDPDHVMLPISKAMIHSAEKEYGRAIECLDEVQRDKLRPGVLGHYHLERGAVLDKLKRYDEAFEEFAAGNRIYREQLGFVYKREERQQLAKWLKNFFVRTQVASLPKGKPRDEKEESPIFVVGFPRSGTTMVEQILSNHPNISAGDELNFIQEIALQAANALGSRRMYPECLDKMTLMRNRNAAQRFRQDYLNRSRLMGILDPGVRRFTDKMPLNEIHLGLIHIMFPEAPIVHVVRHPLDSVLSSHFNDVRHDGHFSFGLETTAEHYAMAMDLVEHYRAHLDLNYMQVHYEALVDDIETHARSLLDFAGEPWDKSCVDFHLNKRYARTASYNQVRQKLYKDSKFRYKHYRKHIDAIIPILEPHVTNLGYSVD